MPFITTSVGGDGSGLPGPQGIPGEDALWNFVGEYNNGADYAIGDLVTYNGGTYYRVGEPNPGYPPGTSYWTTIAEPGINGNNGADGAQGEPGLDAEVLEEVLFTVNGGTLGTQPTFNGAPLFSGSYVKTGPLVHFQIQVDMDNITSFGTGQYYVNLPFPAKYGYKFREGCLHDISAGRDYAVGGHVFAGQSQLTLTSTDTQSGTVFDIPFVFNNPVTLNAADNFHIAGTYITN